MYCIVFIKFVKCLRSQWYQELGLVTKLNYSLLILLYVCASFKHQTWHRHTVLYNILYGYNGWGFNRVSLKYSIRPRKVSSLRRDNIMRVGVVFFQRFYSIKMRPKTTKSELKYYNSPSVRIWILILILSFICTRLLIIVIYICVV